MWISAFGNKEFEVINTRYTPHYEPAPQGLETQVPKCGSTGLAKTFLLVFMGHSGSTALMTSLQQHSKIDIDGFEPVDHGVFVEGPSAVSSLKALKHVLEKFENGTQRNKMVGFKVRPRHLLKRSKEFSDILRMFGTRIIWSYRSNVMKQALGDYAIKYQGALSAYEGIRLSANGTEIGTRKRVSSSFKVDMGILHSLLKSRIEGDAQITKALNKLKLKGCILPIGYESYLKYPDATLKRVQAFLGLDDSEMHRSLRAKATGDRICELVENWDELCQTFYGCQNWRWMIDDFDNGCACTNLHPANFNFTFCNAN